MATASGRKRFVLVLVKPSHYDDDGYVIQWFRSPIPSTTLANLYGLARDRAERHEIQKPQQVGLGARRGGRRHRQEQ